MGLDGNNQLRLLSFRVFPLCERLLSTGLLTVYTAVQLDLRAFLVICIINIIVMMETTWHAASPFKCLTVKESRTDELQKELKVSLSKSAVTSTHFIYSLFQ